MRRGCRRVSPHPDDAHGQARAGLLVERFYESRLSQAFGGFCCTPYSNPLTSTSCRSVSVALPDGTDKTYLSQLTSSAPPPLVSVKLQRALAFVHGMQALRLRGGLVDRSGGVRPCMADCIIPSAQAPDELAIDQTVFSGLEGLAFLSRSLRG